MTTPSKLLPVVAVIVNYNMARELERLLPQVIAQNYDAIYVLDDCSTDNSKEIVDKFASKVKLIAGAKNVGSSANRNRILPVLKTNSIVHYLDADVELVTKDMPSKIQAIFNQPNLAFVGGLTRDPDGTRGMWNYGPKLTLYSSLTGVLQAIVCSKMLRMSFKPLKRHPRYLLSEWPDIYAEPQRQKVFWVIESNMMIKSDTLKQIGCFDESIGNHDIITPATMAQRAGLKTIFDPSIEVIQHWDNNVHSGSRTISLLRATAYLARKLGYKEFFLPNGHFKPKI